MWVDDAFLYMLVLAAASTLNAVRNLNICVYLSPIANMKIQGEEIYGATVPLNKKCYSSAYVYFFSVPKKPFLTS